MLFVNVPFSVVVLAGAFALLKAERRLRAWLRDFDALGALLVTGGMLLRGLRAGEGAGRRLGDDAHDRRSSPERGR